MPEKKKRGNPQNLTPWGPDHPPAKSPGGPKGPRLLTLLTQLANHKVTPEALAKIKAVYPKLDMERLTREYLPTMKVEMAAARGEEWAIKIYYDRMYGKVPDNINMEYTEKKQVFKIGDTEIEF